LYYCITSKDKLVGVTVNSNLIEPQSHILSYPISSIISNSVLDILQQFAIYISENIVKLYLISKIKTPVFNWGFKIL